MEWRANSLTASLTDWATHPVTGHLLSHFHLGLNLTSLSVSLNEWVGESDVCHCMTVSVIVTLIVTHCISITITDTDSDTVILPVSESVRHSVTH